MPHSKINKWLGSEGIGIKLGPANEFLCLINPIWLKQAWETHFPENIQSNVIFTSQRSGIYGSRTKVNYTLENVSPNETKHAKSYCTVKKVKVKIISGAGGNINNGFDSWDFSRMFQHLCLKAKYHVQKFGKALKTKTWVMKNLKIITRLDFFRFFAGPLALSPPLATKTTSLCMHSFQSIPSVNKILKILTCMYGSYY